MSKPKWESDYKRRMMRQARMAYLRPRLSDFMSIGIEEFEAWKGEQELPESGREDYRERRRGKETLSRIYLEAYKGGEIKLDTLLRILRELYAPSEQAMFSKIVWEAAGCALKKAPLKRVPRPTGLKSYIRFLLEFLAPKRRWNKKNLQAGVGYTGKPGQAYLGFPKKTFPLTESDEQAEPIEYPGKNYDERVALVLARFHGMGLKKFFPTAKTITDLVRKRN